MIKTVALRTILLHEWLGGTFRPQGPSSPPMSPSHLSFSPPSFARPSHNFLGMIADLHNTSFACPHPTRSYDPKGASLYSIVIILLYAMTIVIMVAATMFERRKWLGLDDMEQQQSAESFWRKHKCQKNRIVSRPTAILLPPALLLPPSQQKSQPLLEEKPTAAPQMPVIFMWTPFVPFPSCSTSHPYFPLEFF